MPTFETPEPIAVHVDVFVGDVRVTASDRTDTVVGVQPTNPTKARDVDAAESTRVDLENGTLLVRSPKTWKRFSPFDNGGSVQITIEVPTGSGFEAESSMGDLHGEGELGPCRLKTAMGHIRLDHAGAVVLKTSFGSVTVDRATGEFDVMSGSGEVWIRELDGAGVVKNSNGATRIGEVTGNVQVKAANGNISIDRALGSVTAKTASGDIRIGEAVRGVVVLETSAGNVSCGVAPGTAAWLDVHSKVGRVHSTLEPSDAPSAGDETVELRARTSVGNITIERSSDSTIGRRP